MKILKVLDRYTCPGPRYKRLGASSGEDFKEWLIKALNKDKDLTVDLDDTEGYGSSFLEEAFGGLIREGINIDDVKNIQFISNEEPELIDEIKEYIDDAIEELGDCK
ncbi:STAS-like domain-containing protein [Psychromonas sp. SP041]|uniref:STAS-like domain-containing protein n=1 Tax=Psychromonas sp. SP041 TaxID=1365007 RepID=UPI0010C7DCA3|nr:STAS-like domain-containing protein [Psychromonas sp. SP041]